MILQVVAGAVLLAVLVCVIWRPRGLNVAWPAVGGALLVLALRLIPLPTLRVIFADTWDASATLIALFLLSEALDSNGFFSWAAFHLARIARGSGWKLYILILALTMVTTALLANDGAVLILTPIVARLLVKIYKQGTLWLPFVFAVGFFADATSGMLVPSNLTNIIMADANHLSFTQFALWMLIPTLCAALAAGTCFALRFRTELAIRYDPTLLPPPASMLRDRPVFWLSWAALLVLIVGYLVGAQFRLPVAFVAIPVALFMVVVVQIRHISSAKKIVLAAPWNILFYALGMFVVITAAYDQHVLSFLTQPLMRFIAPAAGTVGALFSGSILAAFSAVANNLPATLVGVLVLRRTPAHSMLAIYAMILGLAIGPKFTPYGSLATLLWLGILARNNIQISWRKYFSENWWVTLIALASAFAGLVFVNQFLH